MESELRKLSQAELRQIREWLDDIIEDELEFTPEFERSIQQAERDMVDHHCRHCAVASRTIPSRLFNAKSLQPIIVAVVTLSLLVYLIFFR